MKSKFKYLITAVILAVLLTAFSFSAYASEQTVSEAVENTEENLFSRAFDEIIEYAPEILSTLTLTGSLILAVSYKKGLLPLVEKSLVAIGNAVTKIKDKTGESVELSEKLGLDIDQKLAEATGVLTSLAKRIAELEGAINNSLADKVEQRLEAKELRLVVDAQIDMLYDVFMSSSLPQYQKELMGEKVLRMKEELSANEKKQ